MARVSSRWPAPRKLPPPSRAHRRPRAIDAGPERFPIRRACGSQVAHTGTPPGTGSGRRADRGPAPFRPDPSCVRKPAATPPFGSIAGRRSPDSSAPNTARASQPKPGRGRESPQDLVLDSIKARPRLFRRWRCRLQSRSRDAEFALGLRESAQIHVDGAQNIVAIGLIGSQRTHFSNSRAALGQVAARAIDTFPNPDRS